MGVGAGGGGVKQKDYGLTGVAAAMTAEQRAALLHSFAHPPGGPMGPVDWVAGTGLTPGTHAALVQQAMSLRARAAAAMPASTRGHTAGHPGGQHTGFGGAHGGGGANGYGLARGPGGGGGGGGYAGGKGGKGARFGPGPPHPSQLGHPHHQYPNARQHPSRSRGHGGHGGQGGQGGHGGHGRRGGSNAVFGFHTRHKALLDFCHCLEIADDERQICETLRGLFSVADQAGTFPLDPCNRDAYGGVLYVINVAQRKFNSHPEVWTVAVQKLYVARCHDDMMMK